MQPESAREFAARLASLRAQEDEELARRQLDDLVASLRAAESEVDRAAGLTRYDRRQAQQRLQRMAEDLARVKRERFPRPAFRFASRKLLGACEARAERTERAVSLAEMHSLRGLRGETLTAAHPGSSGEFSLQGLEDCEVTVPFTVSSLYVDSCRGCRIVAGVVSAAAYVDGCAGCRVELACHQLRIHDTTDTEFRIRTGSSPVIERCSGLRFRPLQLGDARTLYGEYVEDLRRANLESAFSGEVWRDVKDFSFLKAGPNPNFEAGE